MRNVIVIGASSGIGRELAVKYLEIGDTVFVGARRTELLRELHLKYHDNSEYFYIDIADNQNASKILSDIFKQIKGVDLVLLCAGTGELNSELSFEAEKTTIDTNVTGFTNDMLHMNKKGYEIWRKAVKPLLIKDSSRSHHNY